MKIDCHDQAKILSAMGKSVSYHSYLMQALKDPKRAEGYIEAAIDENDLELLQDLNNSNLLSTIATLVESQNLFQTARLS